MRECRPFSVRLFRTRIIDIILPFGIWFAFYYPVWIEGMVPCTAGGDLWISVTEAAIGMQAWAFGELPAWNPFMAFGHPIHAGFAGVYYPGLWLYRLLGDTPYLASARVGALHALFAAVGMWFYLRELGNSPRIASFGAAVMAASPRSLALFQSGLISLQIFEAFYPWILWGICRAARRDAISGIAIGGAALGMQALIVPAFGHISAFLVVLTATLETCWRAPRKPALGLLIIAAVGALGLMIGAANVWPAMRESLGSPRLSAAATGVFANVFHPWKIVLIVFPDYYEAMTPENLHSWIFLGAIPIFALTAAARRNVDWSRHLAGAAICLMLAVGDFLPLYRHSIFLFAPLLKGPLRFVGLLPPLLIAAGAPGAYGLLRQAGRRSFAGGMIFAGVSLLLVLAAFRLDVWSNGPFLPSRVIGLLDRGAVAGLRFLAPVAFLSIMVLLKVTRRVRVAGWVILGGALLLDATMASMVLYDRTMENTHTGFGEFAARIEEGQEGRVLELAAGNRALFGPLEYHLPAVRPTSAVFRQDYFHTFKNAFAPTLSEAEFFNRLFVSLPPDPDTRILAALGIRYLIEAETGKDGALLTEIPSARPMYYLTRDWRSIPSGHQITRNELADAAMGAVLIEGPADAPSPSAKRNASSGTARLVDRTFNRLAFDVSCTETSLLVINEQYHENWRALIDGQPALVHRVNGFLRGVPCPIGEHRVVLYYHDSFVQAGLVVSMIGVIICLMLIRHRRRGH